VRSWFFAALAFFAVLQFGRHFVFAPSPSEHPAVAWDRATIQQETAVGELPDRRLTPGAIASTSAAQVCGFVTVRERNGETRRESYARSLRHPYDATWRRYARAVYANYSLPDDGRYVIDHLEPLELGGLPFGRLPDGTWDMRNVWPEPKGDSYKKDRVEFALHDAVCGRNGYRGIHLSLAAAQRAIATDWTRTPVGLP
jgi:hypothetical protein